MADAKKGGNSQIKLFPFFIFRKMLLINSIVVYNMNYEITHKSPKGGFYMKITFIGATHEVTAHAIIWRQQAINFL